LRKGAAAGDDPFGGPTLPQESAIKPVHRARLVPARYAALNLLVGRQRDPSAQGDLRLGWVAELAPPGAYHRPEPPRLSTVKIKHRPVVPPPRQTQADINSQLIKVCATICALPV
jgi:hypothetical protein